MMIIASYCDDSCIYFIYKYFKYIPGSVFVNRLHLFKLNSVCSDLKTFIFVRRFS